MSIIFLFYSKLVLVMWPVDVHTLTVDVHTLTVDVHTLTVDVHILTVDVHTLTVDVQPPKNPYYFPVTEKEISSL